MTPARTTYFPVERLRKDFPILSQTVYGKPLAYFDNAATTQKPKVVLDAMNAFYETSCANVHRGAHHLSERATKLYEEARRFIAQYMNAEPNEIIFVRSTTDALNLLAYSLGQMLVREGDEIILSEMEHHSNIVPWQLLAKRHKAVIRVISVDDQGRLQIKDFKKLLGSKTKIVSLTHISNALGTINPIKEIAALAKSHGAVVCIDGAQGAAHQALDMKDLDCDFYTFSGHKVYGPMGIGVLYGKKEWLDQMPPYQSGGDMIASVTFEKTTFAETPRKFEAGTPNVAAVVGLKKALEYMNQVGLNEIGAYEKQLLTYAESKLQKMTDIRIMGQADQKASVLSFVMEGVHPHDISSILDRYGVAIRAGHLCAQPLMKRFSKPAFARASFSFYNTVQEIDQMVEALEKVREVFSR